ncbi:MAG: oligosaccharide flippase family protein [Cyclobacteriaceae bacterium]|nr:oligosaccharide flippase family protein [Cyclobacteriaceae bacterium]
MVKDVFSQLFAEGRFVHNLAVTFTGNATALVLGFVFTPFIARLYGPAAYGAFALFMAVINNLSPLVTLQFPTGYVTIKDDDVFLKMIQLTLAATIFFTALAGLIIFFVGEYLVNFFEAQAIAGLLWFIPAYLFLLGVDAITLGWNIRLKEFKRAAVGKIFSTTSSKLVTLLFGLRVYVDASGLVIGNALQYPLDSLARVSTAMRQQLKKINSLISRVEIHRLLITYRAYPLFVTTGLLISNFGNQLPVYIISYYFGQTTLGFFALAFSLISMPMNVLVSSSTTVFLQKAAELHHDNPDQLRSVSLRLYKKLFLVSSVSLTALSLISLPLFLILFGQPWRESGIFAAFLAYSFILGVAANPLSVLFRVLHAEHKNFGLNLFQICLKAAGLLAGASFNDPRMAIMGYVLATVLCYAVQLYVIFGMINLQRGIVVRDTVLTLVLFTGMVVFYTFL